MIDKGTIDKVMDTAQGQITEVVSEFVNLKRRGINYIGLCPFHNEKTPSFIVSPHKGIYKCFGCGKGGNAVNFLMDHEQISFIEAIKILGRKFHIHIEEKELSPEEMAHQNDRESMLVVTSFAATYFMDRLHKSDEGKSVGLGYFRERQFRDDIIQKFQLGYSPETKDAFTKEALRQGYKLDFLEKTGLTIVRDDYQADRFRGRVIFPIHSLAGKVIGFGGRILRTNKKTAKYLNSPESEIYHKSRILYGMYQARQEISRQDRCILVEGYTDVLSFHQAGIANVVASSGTALTTDQIRLIARFSKNLTIIFDGDAAGIKASLRGIDLVLEEGLNVKVLLLPDGEDPDSYAKKLGGEALREYIKKHETDFLRFKTGLLMEESKNDPIGRARLVQDIVRTISVIPDSITRSEYVKDCSSLMKVEEQVLFMEIGKLRKKKMEKNYSKTQYNSPVPPSVSNTADHMVSRAASSSSNPFETEEREVLRFLLKFGNDSLGEFEMEDGTHEISVGEYIISELKQDELESSNPLYNKLMQLYEENYGNEGFSSSHFFVSSSDNQISSLATDLIAREYPLSRIHEKLGFMREEKDCLDDLVPKVVTELKWKKVKVLLEEKRQQMKKAEEEGNQEMLMEVLQEYSNLQQAFVYISKELGSRTIV
ncbi:DNA primase [Marinilabilia rubra]|uniref:DNA primase n=1 Tax=Marinilabilia rubra TaxID=2162893 RepID=A0A2U2B8P5_9BACT|nr:DNA primase [Marinilabilia rubra]PWD99461.1 DNA primase [Marinilabilia rubra]